jgi:hypothetical protein
MTRIRVRGSGNVTGIGDAVRQIRQEVAREVGEATIRRAATRLDRHPSGRLASNAMRVEAGAGMATIVSPMGNPGVIPAYRDAQGFSRWGRRFMWWPGARHPVRWVRNYKGLRPLLEAEMSRVTDRDLESINYIVR